MAIKTAPNLFIILCFFFVLVACVEQGKALGGIMSNINDNKIKGMFVFGSSLVDNGNNNFLNTLAKANYLPYGIDFPLGSTGRFSNGKNVIDFLRNNLQLPDYLPVFKDPSTRGLRIIHGVNYASGGSGILNETGSIAGKVMSLNEQIENFEQVTLPELKRELGNMTEKMLGDSIFMIGSGGNDYTLNYFLTKDLNSTNLKAFTSNLIATLTSQLKRLYSRGARRFVLMGIYPLGCNPSGRERQSINNDTSCNEILNRAAHLFNFDLQKLVHFIKPQMPASALVYVNSYKIIMDIIRNPTSKGFSDVRNPCCEVRSIENGGNGISCHKGGSVCGNREVYVYFDGVHPTEALNKLFVSKAYSSHLISEVYPFNIQHLSTI